MKRFDPAIPRHMFWSDSTRDRSRCPQCLSELEKEYHGYVMAVRDGDDIHPLIVGNDGGYFCPECPSVVLDTEAFTNSARAEFGMDMRAEFTVLGLIDFGAVPEEMRSTPLGEVGNPIPLVEFIRKPVGAKRRLGKSRAKKKRRRGKKPKKG